MGIRGRRPKLWLRKKRSRRSDVISLFSSLSPDYMSFLFPLLFVCLPVCLTSRPPSPEGNCNIFVEGRGTTIRNRLVDRVSGKIGWRAVRISQRFSFRLSMVSSPTEAVVPATLSCSEPCLVPAVHGEHWNRIGQGMGCSVFQLSFFYLSHPGIPLSF